MTHQFKVGDKVKLGNINFNEELYSCCEDDVSRIKDLELEIIHIDSDGDLVLNTDEIIDYNFSAHPLDVVLISTKNPRKHSELIKQWAEDDSLEIQASMDDGQWYDVVGTPRWNSATNYRIKPKKVTKWKWAYTTGLTNHTMLTNEYFSSLEELQSQRTQKIKSAVKLEWTAKEFEVEI